MSAGFDLEDIEQRLRNFRLAKGKGAATSQVPQATQAAVTQPLSNEGIETTDHSYQRAGRSIDPIEERINKYLQKPIVLPEIPEEFAKFDSITADLRPVKYDFPDNALAGQAGITLERYTVEEVAILGRTVIPMISSGFSKRGAAALFPLAYNLKAPRVNSTGEYVFPDVERIITSIADERYDEYPEEMISRQGPFEPITATVDVEEESAVYSYLACSMLRLFTKPVANYIKAWNRITDGYAKFYRKQVGMRLPTPTEASMRGLSNWFAVDPRAKVTLYRILWLGNSAEEYMGFKKFLYDMHLTYTGMHIVDILLQLCEQLNCSPGVVLALINCRETERQVQCLTHLLKILADTGECHKKRMWRYGRIFDETFMADLQTKACPKLVYIMASALQMVAPERHSGILKIAQLADVSDENKKKCNIAAKQMLQSIKERL
ncbi:uncharacterized protein LOC122034778 [Zingiber officinale]|uniref:Uncharacterized protein n=1 Tax=Zingiber officinale TaxID=94328 RepID=A0A8J5ENX4_ZINOF|nr:uncharacterized protein LOC122034778 [Zingiber officinale]KAG6468226.1 hypothetical protein ZIOFF_072798 [Zingiber officinale]